MKDEVVVVVVVVVVVRNIVFVLSILCIQRV